MSLLLGTGCKSRDGRHAIADTCPNCNQQGVVANYIQNLEFKENKILMGHNKEMKARIKELEVKLDQAEEKYEQLRENSME